MSQPATQILPDLKGFETYYGLQVSDIGEDGYTLILGHHSDDPLRILAALNRHARQFWGCCNLFDDYGGRVVDLARTLSETWAIVEAFDRHGDWYIRWNMQPSDPEAFPVTVWAP